MPKKKPAGSGWAQALAEVRRQDSDDEEGSEEEGSEEESEDEDAGEDFRSGKYGKLEGTLYGALELGAWTSFTYLEASDDCSKHIHSWAFGDVCGDLVIIRILRGEKAGGASATPQKCYVALLWDLSRNKWAYRTLPQLGPPTAGYTDQPDMLRRFESKLRKFEPPSVAAALSQAARATMLKTRNPRLRPSLRPTPPHLGRKFGQVRPIGQSVM